MDNKIISVVSALATLVEPEMFCILKPTFTYAQVTEHVNTAVPLKSLIIITYHGSMYQSAWIPFIGFPFSKWSVHCSVSSYHLSVQAVRGLLNNPNEPVNELSYFECIESVMENSKVQAF